MRLSWHKGLTAIILHYSNGESTEWSGAVWSRVGGVLSDNIFVTINKYWASLPHEQLMKFETCYRSIYECFEENHDAHILSDEMKPLVENLLGLFNWQQFRLWCVLHGDMILTNGIKDVLDDKDKEGLTYYTEDYTDLMVFSILLKSIMPIWGRYHEELDETIGKYYIHINAMKLIKVGNIINLPPMRKLESYIECFTEIKIKRTGFSILSGIGSEEIPDFLQSLALIKKIIIYDSRDPTGSIVKNMYHLLTERCKEIATVRPNQKSDVDTEGGDLGIADRYKIVQRIPPAVATIMEYDGRNIPKLVKNIDPTVPDALIQKYMTEVNSTLDFSPFHLPLLALVCGSAIKGRTLKIVPYETVLNAIKAAAAVLEHWGYLEIAELLISQPIKKDIYTLGNSGNVRSYTQLHPALLHELNGLYPHMSNGKNPGVTLIDNTIREILKFDWRVRSENFDDMRNSIARLLLKQLGNSSTIVQQEITV